ncbi:MAG: carboxylesterase [Gallionellales bacterium RIFCSPLOWO2_12_FULL_59_22]|nr:MAG: carboxylesterase [Gallionellales bacterium RIFCSPLOWO2_02_FULL_59_110]OGT04211.1 MAG: carboxylesterase [Gallionellales bacterium RIFCSPLOWO2_02_58_13]OGT11374.1 MAG: carboxylesterase [Gallionellales bacterium RIFCSPLOWO2_12_FULL_59_22]
MSSILPHIALETGKQPQHCIIWLHGLGADGQDFVPVADELSLPVPIRYIFPHAPQRPVTINGGFVMRAWYDIAHPSIDAQQDAAGIYESQTAVEALIEQEMARGIAPGNIILAGFSQGGAIALHTALRRSVPLGGILALSTYVPLADTVAGAIPANAGQTPVFMAHGLYDPIVPYALGTASRDMLLKLGYAVEWHEYGMQHSVCAEELRDIEAWLTKRCLRTAD